MSRWANACDAHTYLVTHVRWLRFWRELVAREVEQYEAAGGAQLDLLGAPAGSPERVRLAQVLRHDEPILRLRQQRAAVAVLRWIGEPRP